MAAGALHSDHINYLILRYLQEHGHENAAIAFYRDWNRPHEFRNPEDLPFAPVVRRHALVSVVQDGLLYDELAARGSRYERKFQWTGVNPRVPLEEQDVGSALDIGVAASGGLSRPSSSGKRKGRQPVAARPVEEFPIPAPKRQRRSEGSEAPLVNGDKDAMDVDVATPSADIEEETEAASPNVVSDTEIVEVPERYDSMDVATQTDVKTGLKTSTISWKIDKPGARILHSLWNPDATNPRNMKSLLTVGESLCRVYDIPEALEDVKQITHTDGPMMPKDYVVTATAWHPSGQSATSAIDGIRDLLTGDQSEVSQLFLQHGRDFGSTVQDARSPLLEPASLVLGLRYSPNGEYMLVVRTNLKRGLLQVWRTPDLKRESDGRPVLAMDNTEPVAWRIFEHQALDACWTSNDALLVCGDQGLASAYRLDAGVKTENGFTVENVAVQGLIEEGSEMSSLKHKWDKLRFDEKTGVAVLASTEASMMFTLPIHGTYESDTPSEDAILTLPGRLTALAFQPQHRSNAALDTKPETKSDDNSAFIAAAFEQGFAMLYRITGPSSRLSVSAERLRLDLADAAPALAVAWSPQGTHLAVGGTDVVQVWSRESLEAQGARTCEPLVTWRSDPKALERGRRGVENGRVNGGDVADGNGVNGEAVVAEPSLSWSADGESLGFAVDGQLAVVRFRPPLHAETNGEANGRPSP